MANQMLIGDYAIIGPNTEAPLVIRLTAHLMGFNYREKNPNISLLNLIKDLTL